MSEPPDLPRTKSDQTIGTTVCRILGLDPTTIRHLDLHLQQNGVGWVDVVYHVDPRDPAETDPGSVRYSVNRWPDPPPPLDSTGEDDDAGE